MIEVIFLFFMKLFSGDPGPTIILISLTVNALLLPIYNVADRWQQEERDLLSRMKAKVTEIRAVFRGDTRQMILNTYYRQMGYHPLFSIRSSLGLLIQIPFFLAAYDFLSHASVLHGAAFLFLKDLSQPDGLLAWSGMSINLLPFVMTGFNLLSAFLYTKGLGTKDKAQLFLLAAVFLALLYGSPSGLVLYWTVSNLFSLVKNAAHRLPRPGRVLHLGVLFVVAFITLVPSSGLWGPFRPKLILLGVFLAALVAVVPRLWKAFLRWTDARKSLDPERRDFSILLLASANLALLTGLVVPALLVASSPAEFGRFWGLLPQTLLQSASLFVLIPLSFWALSSPSLKRLLAPVSVVLVLMALLNTFGLPSGGVMNENFQFSDASEIGGKWGGYLSLLAPVLGLAIGIGLWSRGKRVWVSTGLGILAITLTTTGVLTLIPVAGVPQAVPAPQKTSVEPVYHLAKTRPNLFVVYLDRAIGVAFPKVLERQPALAKALDGFVFYPNTLSFGQCTILGAPALFGGYEYTPDALATRDKETIMAKVNEALKVLPGVFGEAGYRVTFSDPTYANLQLDRPDISVFQGMKNVTAVNLKGDYKDLLLQDLGLQQEKLPEHQRFDYDILLRFGLFRLSPPILRPEIYRNGVWWHANKVNRDFELIMRSFSSLHYLPGLTAVDSDQPTLNIHVNDTTHENGAFGPDLLPTPWDITVPLSDVQRFGDIESAINVYNQGACIKALTQWFGWLKTQGVWDNTKIIVVSDHGHTIKNGVVVPGFERFNPLLLVKDFGSVGPLRTSDEFMTNADVPAILVQSLGGANNPATGKPLTSEPKGGRLLVHYGPSNTPDPGSFVLPSFQTWELTDHSLFTKDGWRELRP